MSRRLSGEVRQGEGSTVMTIFVQKNLDVMRVESVDGFMMRDVYSMLNGNAATFNRIALCITIL